MEKVDLEGGRGWEGGAIFVRRVIGGMAFGRHFTVGGDEWWIVDCTTSMQGARTTVVLVVEE